MPPDHKFDSLVVAHKLAGTSPERIHSDQLKLVSLHKLYEHGFRNWDNTMMLLPLWILAYMAPGSVLKCIDNTWATVGTDEIDDDTRAGCIAYGVERTDIPLQEIKP